MAIQSATPSIKVRIEKGKAEKTDFSFTKPFRVGRDKSCELRIDDPAVSRFHAEVWFLRDKWLILDLESANGTFVDGKKVERSPLVSNTRIQLGENGPIFSVKTEEVPKAEHTKTDQTVTRYIQRYFSDSDDTDAGEHTMMLRRAFDKVQKKQKRKFGVIIAVVACLCLVAGTYAVVKHREARKQKLLAENIFYAMKSLELEFAGFLKTARLRKDAYTIGRVSKYKAKREEMQQSYDQFVETLEVYGKKISPEERIILRLARTFGECEINMPPGFVAEVSKYIEKWKSSDRLEQAIVRAKRNGYTTKIAETMLAHDLPPQFFYLALQESNLNVNACGPKTRYGIAKGMWQFIPSTGVYYGLRTGPLVHLGRPDPRDERHHLEKTPVKRIAWRLYAESQIKNEKDLTNLLEKPSDEFCKGLNRPITNFIQSHRDLKENKSRNHIWPFYTSVYKNKEKVPDIKSKDFHKRQITQWHYDPFSYSGGEPGDPLPKKLYLDLTRLGEALGLDRINAYKEGWQLGKSVKLNKNYKSFKKLADLAMAIHNARIAKDVEKEIEREEKDNITSDAEAGTSSQEVALDSKYNRPAFIVPPEDSLTLVEELRSSNEKSYDKRRANPSRCNLCGKPIDVAEKYFEKRSPWRKVHLSCVKMTDHFKVKGESKAKDEPKDREAIKIDFDALKPLTLLAWAEVMADIKLKPTPDLRVDLPKAIQICDTFDYVQDLREADFFVYFENSSGNSNWLKLPGSMLRDALKLKSGWQIVVQPKWRRQSKGFRAPSTDKDSELLRNWRYMIKKEGFEEPGLFGEVTFKIGWLETFAAMVDDYFRNQKLLCKIIDGDRIRGKSNHKGWFEVRGGRFMKDFIKRVHGWKMHIRPHMSGVFPNMPGSTVFMPREGNPRCTEWWHFESSLSIYKHDGKANWEELMAKIGWTTEGLKKAGY